MGELIELQLDVADRNMANHLRCKRRGDRYPPSVANLRAQNIKYLGGSLIDANDVNDRVTTRSVEADG